MIFLKIHHSYVGRLCKQFQWFINIHPLNYHFSRKANDRSIDLDIIYQVFRFFLIVLIFDVMCPQFKFLQGLYVLYYAAFSISLCFNTKLFTKGRFLQNWKKLHIIANFEKTKKISFLVHLNGKTTTKMICTITRFSFLLLKEQSLV